MQRRPGIKHLPAINQDLPIPLHLLPKRRREMHMSTHKMPQLLPLKPGIHHNLHVHTITLSHKKRPYRIIRISYSSIYIVTENQGKVREEK